MLDMKRREFIALAGGSGLLLAPRGMRARAEQPATPVPPFKRCANAETPRLISPASRIPSGVSSTPNITRRKVLI
jgi:hypothetical protein